VPFEALNAANFHRAMNIHTNIFAFLFCRGAASSHAA
jgi:hypothetical protein